MNFSILTIGNEILSGRTLDTNSQWISQQLGLHGLKLGEIRSIGDDEAKIFNHLDQLRVEHDVVIITGGLGPTHDDLTKVSLTKYFGLRMEERADVLRHLEALMQRNQRPMNDAVKSQAMLPKGIEIFINDMGSASGMLFEEKGFYVLSLPGVPYEMKHLISDGFLPYWRERFEKKINVEHRNINTAGISESKLAIMIEKEFQALPEFIDLAYLPSTAKVTIRLSGSHEDGSLLEQKLDQFQRSIAASISDHIYSYGEIDLAQAVGEKLMSVNKTIGIAESCTGGLISHQITSISGSSGYFEGSVISYSNQVKSLTLGVSPQTLERHGAVSAEVVKEMVIGAIEALHVDYAIAVSGIAGPTGGSKEKPVGTIWIAVGDKDRQVTKRVFYAKSRSVNINFAATMALFTFYQFLKEQESKSLHASV